MRPRAVFLDAGNTLVGLDYPLITARIQAAGHPVTIEAVRQAEERARPRLDPHLAVRRRTEGADIFLLYFRYMLEGLGIRWNEGTERLAADLRSVEPFGLWRVPIPGAAPALTTLRDRGLRLAVVSNSNGSVAKILDAVGLTRYLDTIVDSGVVGAEKPDPRIFAYAATALGVRPDEAVHVGDLYSVDVLGAQAAGCQAILLDPAGVWIDADCPKAPDIVGAARLIEAMLPPSGSAGARQE